MPNSDKKIVIIVDELDRCRPTFAIELLERVKHLFDTGKYLFIFTICATQLKESVRQIYGNAYEETGYFRRFFDIQFYLPLPKVKECLEKNQKLLTDKYPENKDLIIAVHDSVPENGFSLRTCDQLNTFLNLILQIQNKNILANDELMYLTFGIVIRFVSYEIFKKYL
ncbi:MAG: P-loop NTPase fold protein [Bacilli bacterium]